MTQILYDQKITITFLKSFYHFKKKTQANQVDHQKKQTAHLMEEEMAMVILLRELPVAQKNPMVSGHLALLIIGIDLLFGSRAVVFRAGYRGINPHVFRGARDPRGF